MSDQSLQQLLVTNFGLLPSGYTGSAGTAGAVGFTGSAAAGGGEAGTIPVGTTAERPASPVAGAIRINSTTSQLEVYYSGSWSSIAAVGLGRSAASPAASATALQSAGYTTNGNYWITIADAPVECYVNFTLDGGPYILAMVASNTGSTYGYDSAVWTNTTGGASTALNPAENANQVHMSFYNLATTRTGLALHQNSTSYFHFTDHSSFTARNLAGGSGGALTAVGPNNTDILPNTLAANGAAGRPQGWGNAITDAGFAAMGWGATYYRYGWQHGVPDPSGYGWVRFGWSADQDSSDSRDRFIGIGVKNGGAGPLGSSTVSAGSGNFTNGATASLRGFLYIKN
jgi:hypothetical protein